MKTQFRLSLFFFAFYGLLFSQEALPFKTQNEFYIYGDAVVIGNNILSKDIKKPFNDASISNDDVDMVYVDIDDNPETFSSSSAKLTLPKNHSKIKYAALYWSATYSYDQGFRRESNNQFFFQGKRVRDRSKISKIKLKLPNGEYKNINGNVVFDGGRQAAFAINSPYVCKADVTKLLRNAKDVNGDYTVANINASKGYVSGGSAAGWFLYVVYEAPTENPKYITTYNGFAHVGVDPVILKFENFKSLEEGEINTSLILASLEGDSALTEDECVAVNPKLKRASILYNNLRPRNNFFNSKITIDNDEFTNRTPNSENTLGFDVAKMAFEKSSQPIIDNNTTEIELAFNSQLDRFYLYFTAFQTEISKSFYEEKKESNIAIAEETAKIKPVKKSKNRKKKPKRKKRNKVKKAKVETKPEPKEKSFFDVVAVKKEEPVQEEIVKKEEKPEEIKEVIKPIEKVSKTRAEVVTELPETPKFISKPITNNDNPDYLNRENYLELLTKEDYAYETQTFIRILNQSPTKIKDVPKGHYIIAKLLANENEAIFYQEELKEERVFSTILKDEKNKQFYVALFNSENFYDVFMLRKALIKKDFLRDVWIININLDINPTSKKL